MLLAASITMGFVAYIVADVRQRKAFLDTRQSSEMRLTIEDQARQQVMYQYSLNVTKVMIISILTLCVVLLLYEITGTTAAICSA